MLIPITKLEVTHGPKSTELFPVTEVSQEVERRARERTAGQFSHPLLSDPHSGAARTQTASQQDDISVSTLRCEGQSAVRNQLRLMEAVSRLTWLSSSSAAEVNRLKQGGNVPQIRHVTQIKALYFWTA